jgi:dTDP-4-dehydrorhamnose 3,5-epimerase
MAKKIETKPLIFRDLGKEGGLCETLRADDPIFEGKFGQNLISFVNSGIIKGLHLHHNQTEYTTCIKGNILYITIIERPEGPVIKKFSIGEKNRVLIKTPPETWHGYKAVGKGEAIVLYTMDKPYNPEDIDTEDKNPFALGDIWYA